MSANSCVSFSRHISEKLTSLQQNNSYYCIGKGKYITDIIISIIVIINNIFFIMELLKLIMSTVKKFFRNLDDDKWKSVLVVDADLR